MGRRRYDDGVPSNQEVAQGLGCLIVLVVSVFVWFYQLVRPRPKAYNPDSPDTSETGSTITSTQMTDSNVLVLVLGIVLAIIGIVLLLSRPPQTTVGYTLLAMGILAIVKWYQANNAIAEAETKTTSRNAVTTEYTARMRTYTIYPPRDKPDFVIGSKLMSALLTETPYLTFQIVGNGDSNQWRIIDLKGAHREDTLMSQIRAHYPGCEVELTSSSSQVHYPLYRRFLLFHLANEYLAPLPFLESLKSYDPLQAITQQMDFVRSDLSEEIVYSLIVLISTPTAVTLAGKRLQEGLVKPLGGLPPREYDQRYGFDERLLNTKLSGPLYHAFLVVTVQSSSKPRIAELESIASTISQFSVIGHNQLVRTPTLLDGVFYLRSGGTTEHGAGLTCAMDTE